MFFKEIEFEIILIAICVTFIYGFSPITYKLLVIDNNIKFETYLFKITIIIGLYPIITLILSVLILNEKINLKTFIGFILALIGITIIFY